VIAPGGYLQARAMSPLQSENGAVNGVSPQRERLVARVNGSSPMAAVQLQYPQVRPAVQVKPAAQTVSAQGVNGSMSEDLLKRIDGVVSDMERELSDDLAACVKSPLDLRSGNQASISRGPSASAEETESTIEWIDKQIWAIEHRREACEMRQSHLADLKRLVTEGDGRVPDTHGEEEEFTSSKRLTLLEAEHEQLKKQVEIEREDLVKVRSTLEMECERRLREVRNLAESVEEEKQRALAAEDAANQRAREATLEVQSLQERLREAEATAEQEREQAFAARDAHSAAGADLKQLEENSRAVLGDCRVLQQRVRELEVERAALLDVQASAEEERRNLHGKIQQLEAEKTLEAHKAVEEHSQHWRQVADGEMNQLRTTLQNEAHSKHTALLTDFQKEQQARLEAERKHQEVLEDVRKLKLDQEKLQADKEAEKRAKEEAESKHQAVLRDAQQLKMDQQKLDQDREAEKQARLLAEQKHSEVVQDIGKVKADQQKVDKDKEAEKQARLLVEQKHAAVVKDMEQLKSDKQHLEADKEAERKARALAEEKHAQVVKDMELVKADKQRLEQDKQAEQLARQQAEVKHAAVMKDVERVSADHQRVTAEKEEEQRLRQIAEKKHAESVKDAEALKSDSKRLQEDKDKEEQAKKEVERLHKAVLDEKNDLHGHHGRLQELLEAEKQAKMKMEQKHADVERDKQKVEGDKQELQRAKEAEESARKEAEAKHKQLLQDMEKLRQDQAKLEEDKKAEKKAKEEMEKKHAAVVQDMQRLQSDKSKLEADHTAETRAKEELQARHAAVTKDMEQVQSDQRKLQMDKDFEQRAKEEANRRHQAVVADLEQLHADQQKLKADKDAEQLARQEVERKHKAVSNDLERIQADHQKLKADKDAEERARAEVERKHQAVVQDMERLQSDHRRLQADKEAELRAKEQAIALHMERADKAEGDHRSLQAEHRALHAEKEKHMADHATTKRNHEDVLNRMKTQYDDEHTTLKSLHSEETARLKALQKDEVERLKSYHSEVRGADTRALEEVQTRHSSLVQQLESRDQQVRMLEHELDELKISEEQKTARLQSEKATLEHDVATLRRIKSEKEAAEKDLREALDSATSEVKMLTQQLDDRNKQVNTLRQQYEDHSRAQDQKLAKLVADLEREQEEGEQLRRELEEARITGETLQRDAEDAMQKSDMVKQQIEVTWSEKLEKAERELKALRDINTISPAASPSYRTMQSPQRQSLWAEPMSLNIPGVEDALLPDSKEPFVEKVRQAHEGVGKALQNAGEVHFVTLRAQLQGAAASKSKGWGLRSGTYDYDNRRNIELERRTASSRVDARLHDLNALREEVDLEHQMAADDKEKVIAYIDTDVHRCQEEIALLKSASALSDVPELVIEALIELSEGGSREFDGGFSPAHWAAQFGRRDILEFVRKQDRGLHMINSRDIHGRAPLFYAERSKRVGLAHFLRSDIGATVDAFRPTAERPDVAKVPPAYLKVLETIETRGWHAVKWKDDLTMLHWAAGKGNKDLCQYLIKLNGDVNALDSQARTPADCARSAGHSSLLSLLEGPQAFARKKSIAQDAFLPLAALPSE